MSCKDIRGPNTSGKKDQVSFIIDFFIQTVWLSPHLMKMLLTGARRVRTGAMQIVGYRGKRRKGRQGGRFFLFGKSTFVSEG